MSLLYHAYVYLEFLILACTIYILAPEFVNEGESVEIKTIAILVSKDEYFFENAPITLEEIESMLEGAEGELVVDITDNNATHKAYDKLVDKLTDLEITFIEE